MAAAIGTSGRERRLSGVAIRFIGAVLLLAGGLNVISKHHQPFYCVVHFGFLS